MEFRAHEVCFVAGHAHLIGRCNMFLNVVNVIRCVVFRAKRERNLGPEAVGRPYTEGDSSI